MPPRFPHQNQGAVLRKLAKPSQHTPTGLSPSKAGHSRPLRLRWGGFMRPTPLHHIRLRFSLRRLVWALPLSVAPTQGIPCWFLFLPLLRCFTSGGSHSLPGAPWDLPHGRIPIQGSPDLRLHAPTRGLSQLAAPFLSARAELSTRRLSVSGLGETLHLQFPNSAWHHRKP